MAKVHLTSEKEPFAQDCVQNDRQSNEPAQAVQRLRRHQDDDKRAFTAMLDDVRREARLGGTHSINCVADEMDAIIAGAD